MGCRSSAPYEKADHALTIRNANNFKLRNVEVFWDKPESPKWKSALEVEAVKGLAIEGFAGRQARLADSVPAIVLRQVEGVILRGCTAPAGTAEFVHVAGAASRSIQLIANDLREARAAFGADGDVRKDEIRSTGDLLRKD